MKESIVVRTVTGLVAIPLVLFIGFIGMIFSSLSGGDLFYTPLVAVVAIGAALFILIGLCGFLRAKTYLICLGSFIALCGLAAAGYEIKEAYVASFATVGEQEANLEEYRPFGEPTKAARLTEPPTLTIAGNLLRLDGATALYPLYAAFAQAVYPKGDYPPYDGPVMSSTTPLAYERLINGEADIIFAAQPSQEQLNAAKRRGVQLKLTPIGREAFVFFVQADNPVAGLTTEQIRGIYAGEITNWREVGGKNSRIRAFQRPDNSGSQTALQQLMEGKALMKPPRENVVSGMGGIIERTADYRNFPNAIGYSFLFFVTEMIDSGEIRILEIDGIAPERESISSETYPLTASFYAVTAGTLNPHAQELVDWILSDQGQRLVERTGYTPVK